METATMGRVLTEATIENLRDLYAADQKLIPPDQVRRVTIRDALADTGATMLSLPARIIRQLGLAKTGRRRVNSSLGMSEADVYDAVRLTIQGRDCPLDVLEVPDSVPVLIGQLVLAGPALVVDPPSWRLI